MSASVEEVMAAIRELPEDLEWRDVADRLVPVFPRVQPQPPGGPEPLRVFILPGISLGFGIDAGPAFITVDEAMLERWDISRDVLLDRTLANLDRLIAETLPGEVFRSTIGDVPVAALQSGSGSASTFVLRPRSLARLLGDGRQLVIAPMRNLLLWMSPNVDRGFAAWLFEEIAVQDPNCLAPMAFLLEGGEFAIEPLGEAYGSA